MIKQGDKVRSTDKAIRECRKLFGRHARLQAKDRDVIFTVLHVKETPSGYENIIVLDCDGWNEFAECHLEHYNKE